MSLKRWVSFVFCGLGATILGGCPIYPDSRDHRVCLESGVCYSCPDDYYSSDCYAYGCGSDYDCPVGYACSNGQCVGAGYDGGYTGDSGGQCTRPSDCPSGQNCGADDRCHPGDCSNSGCPSGYQCKLSNGTLQCVGTGTPDGGNNDGGFTGCHNDSECTPAGSKCLDGTCVAPPDQCFDTTQCPNNEQCVAGVCTPGCANGAPCPTGYTCDPKTNVCSGNTNPCGATADGGTCKPGTVCVEDHCVSPCGTGNTCPAGEVCVDGGCIPDQKPQFTCSKEGTQDACAAGSICIHHSCYIACSPDAGADACKNADKFNICKSVTTSSGTYSVCGSASNLGTDCDPTQGKNCPGAGVCVDGFCR
jgi:hypothetical protein